MREVREISIEQIHPNRHQPRLEFNEDALMELAQSIRENGLIQPITVREDEDGYETPLQGLHSGRLQRSSMQCHERR